MQRAVGALDEPLHFFPGEDLRQPDRLFGCGQVFHDPEALEGLEKKEP